MSAKCLRVRGCADRQALRGRTGSARGAPNWRVNGLASGGAPPLPPAFGGSPSRPRGGRFPAAPPASSLALEERGGGGPRVSAGRGFARIGSSDPFVHAAEVQDAVRIEALLEATADRQAQGGRRLKDTSTAARSESGARISVAWPLADPTARRTADAAASVAAVATQARPPPQSKKRASPVSPRLAANSRPRGSRTPLARQRVRAARR